MVAKKANNRRFKVLMVFFTVIFVFIALRVFVGNSNDTGNIVDWQRYNDSINLSNKAFAERHPHQFTDVPHKFEKDSGVFRIAVLGDSFIWGDGLPYDSAWSHKLEQSIVAKYDNVEVMHWGRNGWQTKDEFEFYTKEGFKYQPDLLILGFVDNDPDLGLFQHMDPHFRNNYWLLYKIWPAAAEKVLAKLYAISYGNWQERLYGEENLALYEQLLQQFMDTLENNGQDYFMVQTPACLEGDCNENYLKIQPLFDKLGLEYTSLIPACEEKLSGYNYLDLRANPVNGHPGTLMTNLFADEVLHYLEATKRLPPVR
jgi:hypothetical protein